MKWNVRTRAAALWARTKAILGTGYSGIGRAIRWVHERHGAFAILLATAALIVTTWQVIEARRASSREIGLFRDQLGLAQNQFSSAERQLAIAEDEYASTARPILVPLPKSDSEPPFVTFVEGMVSFRFRVQNLTGAPVLSGSAYIVPPGSDFACPADWETSETKQPALAGAIPPVPGNRTVTLLLIDARFLPDLRDPNPDDNNQQLDPEDYNLCTGVQYADASGTVWMTEWQWQRNTHYRGPAEGWVAGPWEPQQIRTCRLEDDSKPVPTHAFISCRFHAAD